MSDDGRRVPRTFEPPPWERDQFEELARRKAEEAALREAEEAAAKASVLSAVKELGVTAPAAPEAPGAPAEAGGAPAAGAEKKDDRPVIDQAKIDAMLLELAGQDRPVVHEIRRFGRYAAWVLTSVGVIILGLGVVLAVRGGTQGLAGAGMVVTVGVFVIGFAVWLGFRAGRGQGS